MTHSKLTRRRLLKLGLGAAQVGLLGSAGYLASAPSSARAAVQGRKRLLVIYGAGGWIPQICMPSLSAAQMLEHIITPVRAQYDTYSSNITATYDPLAAITNMDGSGEAFDPEDASIKRIQYGWQRPPSEGYSSGFSWHENRLWEDAVSIHGIDAETVAHFGARVGLFCGVAGNTYTQPSIQAMVASRLFETSGRPLPSVALHTSVLADPLSEGARASPILLRRPEPSLLAPLFTENRAGAWDGLRGRSPDGGAYFDGSAASTVGITPMDRWAMSRTHAHAERLGVTSAPDPTYGYLEQIHNAYRGVSARLTTDIVSVLESIPAWRDDDPSTFPSGMLGPTSPYSITEAEGPNVGASNWEGQLDMAYRLIKSNLCTSTSVLLNGYRGYALDTHSPTGPIIHYMNSRAVFEIVGRFLGRLKRTEDPNGIIKSDGTRETLLDTTLVMYCSEFARTWPGYGDDHWAYDSVMLAGGGIHGNRSIGNYDVDTPFRLAPVGSPMQLGDQFRPPNRRDVLRTVAGAFGIGEEQYFLPNEPQFIPGVLREEP